MIVNQQDMSFLWKIESEEGNVCIWSFYSMLFQDYLVLLVVYSSSFVFGVLQARLLNWNVSLRLHFH